MGEEEYNGWGNRETWAVKLHWDNNAGDYEYFTNTAREFKEGGKSIGEFAYWLQEQAEQIFDAVINIDGEENIATKEAKMFVTDVGSLWRVDWREIAEAYYSEIE